jgi:hypothetical protein
MATSYKVVLNGNYMGKDILNSLYYRTALDLAGGAFGLGGAVELAEEIEQEIVPAWMNCKPASYSLQSIDIYPRNNAFELLYQLPFKKEIGLQGTAGLGGQGLDGPMTCVNIRFNLEPQLIGLQAVSAPKRGYIALGPIPSAWIEDSGKLTDSFFFTPESVLNVLKTRLAENLESIDPPCVWFPIRVSEHSGALGLGNISWGIADVMSCTVDEYTSKRSSRRIHN